MENKAASDAGKTILMLEDIRIVAETLRQYLIYRLGSGYTIKVFPTMASLLAHGLVGDVLISDLSLPDSDEYRTAAFLMSQLSTIAIVCYSSSTETGLKLEVESNGKIKYFCKSGSIEELAKHIKRTVFQS